MKKTVSIFLALLMFNGFSNSISVAHALASGLPPHRVILGAPYWYSGQTKDGWAWAKMSWTADNSVYAALRRKIDRQIADSSDPVSVADSYKLSAAAKPGDPLAEFAYGYAALLVCADSSLPIATRQFIITDIPDELAKATFPNTYDYARLRFLAESAANGIPSLIPIGFRLLQIQPVDKHVQYLYAQDLAYSETRSNIDTGIAYVSGMMKEYPNDPLPYLKRGFMYLELQQLFGIQADRQKGIDDYHTYINMTPATDTIRTAVINELKSMNWN